MSRRYRVSVPAKTPQLQPHNPPHRQHRLSTTDRALWAWVVNRNYPLGYPRPPVSFPNVHRSLPLGKTAKTKPNAVLDLHGHTLDSAFIALKAFLVAEHKKASRLVLVITGTGKNPGNPCNPGVSQERGILNRHVPRWLENPHLSFLISRLVPTGCGAFYLYLKNK